MSGTFPFAAPWAITWTIAVTVTSANGEADRQRALATERLADVLDRRAAKAPFATGLETTEAVPPPEAVTDAQPAKAPVSKSSANSVVGAARAVGTLTSSVAVSTTPTNTARLRWTLAAASEGAFNDTSRPAPRDA